ncbi:MAG TPA: pyridoxamine 5'-phosphate oxidase family protein [Gemmatimonadales bacterium]|nr:pyridoxamine 5'-phosphate oxidase family protein [Gemmatimonadales bacterium]
MTDPADHLRALYPAPNERAVRKQLDHLDVHCRRFIELSPLVVMASVAAGDDGPLDASPRGGAPGFVKALDAFTLLLPDAPGNNRLDSLSNIAATERVGLLFLIPGIDETLRVNGAARVSDDDALLAHFAADRHPPRVVVHVTVQQAYLHCAKAFMRSRLWSAAAQVERSTLPTIGKMINDQLGLTTPAETHEAMLARYAKDL